MKLNPDCIRDILFAIESLSKPHSLLTSDQLYQTSFLSKYTSEEIYYHLQQLDWSGYIITPNHNKTIDGTFIVNDLSPTGHEFISNIRQDNNWSKVKSISKEIGSETLSTIKSIAENVIATAINSSMGLN